MAVICEWCGGPIRGRARRDAKYCSTGHRQAAWRAKASRAPAAATDRPARLAYADPPYVGLARRYYGDQPTYAGEVDHHALLGRLASTYDGWALSCSSSSVPSLLAMAYEFDPAVRLAIWYRRPKPNRATRHTAYEGVIYRAARRPVARVTDVLLEVESRPRPTLPGSVIGMKPPAMLEWVFLLIGARPGDELDDLYPGSGMVGRVWSDWSGQARPTAWELAAGRG